MIPSISRVKKNCKHRKLFRSACIDKNEIESTVCIKNM